MSVRDVVDLAYGRATLALDDDASYRAEIQASYALLQKAVADNVPVYGVNRGFGDSCGVEVSADEISELPINLTRYHGCGTGRILSEVEAAATVAARVASLARGRSGVREILLERLCALLNARLFPRIPAEGSVGASGDLTPLSYLAALLMGEREATLRGEVMPAAQALAQADIEPLRLEPKESLAIMNGTSAMTGLACLAHDSATRLARLASSLTAMTSRAIRGEPGHFDERIFALKPHAGQVRSAQWIRDDLAYTRASGRSGARLQDRYSVRCAPHVIGVMLDALTWTADTLDVEINSVNDNPIIDPETEQIFSGGNFYGGHVCQAMDTLKAAVAGIADLLDRQLGLMCDPVTNQGLSANLAGVPGSSAHFGFKAMQITTSALAAEALKLTMPASAFSRSTENHNQDKVSMGTIAARDCLRIVELTETVAVIHLLGACQALDLRDEELPAGLERLRAEVRKHADRTTVDRAMDRDIENLLQAYRAGSLEA